MCKNMICQLPSTATSYEIQIRVGLLDTLHHHLTAYGSRIAIVSDENTAPLYGKPICQSLLSSGWDVSLFSFPSGEKYKTRAIKEQLEDQFFEKGLGRDTCLLAIGGGVVTDLGGYIAATYCRGIPLIMIPTSLLGMVDASIGGKTGVNVPHGKNMLGCLYPPKKVLIDPSTLQSLPQKEIKNGVVEMIKHALIADQTYFDYLENHADDILSLKADALEKSIFESCRIKKEIVEIDEKGNGKRNFLNFGHTIGHALETLTHYSLGHGEAVAIGILVESHMALQMGYLDQNTFKIIISIFLKYGIPLLPPKVPISSILHAIKLDKKSINGNPRFVMLKEIGSPLCHPTFIHPIEEKLIINSLNWMFDDLCNH